MSKLVLLAALLAVLVAAALPTFAALAKGGEDHHKSNRGGDGDRAISQESEQDAESGDVNQSLSVSNRGDNPNQCVGIQRAANTGNAQNLIDVIQRFSEMDDFEFVEAGSTIEVNPTSETRCDRQITIRPHQLAARGVH